VPEIPRPQPGKPFTIVDFGCSEGKNSIAIVKASIDAVRAIRPGEQFFVVHDDLPANNFNRLIFQLYSSPDSLSSIYGATADSPVFVYASGGSFYSRVVPDQFLNLGVSSSSVHWTSSLPNFKAHIFHAGASAAEQAAFAKIAALDWATFLEKRTEELVPGGKLIVTLAARINDPGDPIEGSNPRDLETFSAQSITQLLNDVLLQKLNEGEIERSAFERVSLPIYCRNYEEIVTPVETLFKNKLAVDYIRFEWVQCPLHARFLEDKDASAYASGLTGILRAFSEPVLSSGLFGALERRKSVRENSGAQEVLDSIYSRVEKTISSNPGEYSFYPCHATIVLSRF
jgi:hypothetical protein